MHRPTTLTGFYCGACEARFPTREEREAHKATAHAERDAMIAAGKARRAEREARGQNRPVGIVEAPRSLPKGNGGGRSRFNGYEAGPTEKQMNFIRSLCEERNLPVETPKSKKGASETIERLLATPKPKREAPKPSSKVPAGYYAIDGGGKNATTFYRVDVPERGKWEGYTFVKLVIGGNPDQNVSRNASAGILARIEEAGIQEAMARYGHEIGRCGRCNRTLTDDESRAAGIGPVCRTK